MPSKAIRHALTKLEAACIDASFDEGPTEDVLDTPRMLLARALRSVDSFRLSPHSDGIRRIGELQARLGALLIQMDRCLPRTSVETRHGAASRAMLADIVAAIPQLIEDAKALDQFVSPLAVFD